MKTLWALLPSAAKAIFQVILFFVSLGWLAYGAVIVIVKAEGKEIKEQVLQIRKVDIEHIDKRFDQVIREIRKEK